jgi:adenosylcobinamide kinase/adenosylcobinamide-phosphate guanylyltransferase
MRALIYGGSGSGKSALAEKLLVSLAGAGEKIYLATMEPFGTDAHKRIERHRQMRAEKGFFTIERYAALEGVTLAAGCSVLLECLGNLVANEIFSPGGAGAQAAAAVERGLDALTGQASHLVVVSSDIGGDGVDYPAQTKAYQQLLGDINRRLAGESDIVIEVVCGIGIFHKGAQLCGF